MTPKAQAVAEVLINRHARLCTERERKTARSVDAFDVQACIITYVKLCKEAKVGAPIGVGYFLNEIHEKCVANGWPTLASLVVKKLTRKPAMNYPGKDWNAEIRRCIAFPGYPPISDPAWS